MAEATLTSSRSAPKSGENSGLWLLKLVTGPLIFVLIIIHFIVNHLVGETGLLTYSQVVEYYQVWVVPIMEGLFLALVVAHSLLGLRSVILDLRPSKGLVTVMNWVFLVFGLVVFIYGIWLIRVITQVGMGA